MAEYRILFSPPARRDLLAMRRWLSQPGSGLRARLRIARISRAVAELRFAPLRWPIGKHDGARECPVEGYRIVYRIEESLGHIRILRVFAPYQDQSLL